MAVALAACALFVSACGPRRPEPVPLPPKPLEEIAAGPAISPQPATIPAGARGYDIDPQGSIVTIEVRRAGPFAKLGHNHVVTSRDVRGIAWQGSDPAGSGFELRVPVATLVVDDPAARAAAGADFPGDVPEAARTSTYRNMLRPEVLDAANYPDVVVRATSLAGTWEHPIAAADVTIRGTTRRLDIPIAVEQSARALVARGSFTILQSEFGITPFSVAGGAVQVADELVLEFEIVAVAR